MTAVSSLLRQIDAPPIRSRTGVCAAAILADADALAAEWSDGDALSMVRAEETAQRNAAAILVEAAIRALSRDKVQTVTVWGVYTRQARISGVVLAELLSAYQAACVAEREGNNRNLELEAEAIIEAADELAERFRLARSDEE